MQNPIQTESDLLVFLDLFLENTPQNMELPAAEDIAHSLDQWSYITQYAQENSNTSSAALVVEMLPTVESVVQKIKYLYQSITGNAYIPPEQRLEDQNDFSTSKFLQRIAEKRETQAFYNPWSPKNN